MIISNAVTIEEKKLYFKMFELCLERPTNERTENDEVATAKVLQ
jgi:hypothetical protein